MGNKTLLALCLAFFVCPCAGQSGSSTTSSERTQQGSRGTHPSSEKEVDRSALHKRNWRYQIHPDDVLEVNFPFTPEFNQTVQPDGYITLRGLGDLPVEGKTLPEVTQGLRTPYGKILHEPVITADLKDFEKPYFILGGDMHPGKFELRSDLTAAQAVAIAGGFPETAKHSQVLLFCRISDEWAKVMMLSRWLRAYRTSSTRLDTPSFSNTRQR